MNELIKVILPQQVKVRKYDVDIESLKLILKEHKVNSGLTIKQISDKLELPKTLVEHWFRGDNSFSIPDEDTWLRLKELLNIENDEFDESVMTFEIRDGVYEKSNRVYDSNGIAPTLTVASAENERYIIYDNCSKEDIMNKDKPILVGGIGEINFGKQFRQGNRIYDSENIAMCLMAQPVGNTGGYSYLYKITNKINNKGDNNLNNYIKNLTKFNFNMEEVKVFDSFAGIGALHQSLNELGVPVKLVGMSEIDVDAIISYSGVHNLKLDKIDSLEDKEMREYLIERNIGYDFVKGKSCIPRLKKDKLVKCYKASVLTNNLGDISKLNYADIPNFDLFNMSFPCTDVSNAGKQKGFTNEDGTTTRSGLYVYGIEVIKAKKPKYIMIENVKGLIQKKFVSHFTDMVEEIESLGYNCYYPKKDNGEPTCLNAKNYGIPQNRERIFVICIRKDVDNGGFNFPQGFDNGIRLKDLLEDKVDDKYYLSQDIQNRFKLNGNQDIDHNKLNVVGSSAPDFRTIGQRDLTYGINGIMSTLTATDYKQPKQIIDTNTIIKQGDIPKEVLNDNERQRRVYSKEGISPTVLARTDNAKILDTNELKVDEKYYLDKTKEFFIKNSFDMEEKRNGFRFEPHIKNNANISKTITTRAGARMDDNFILDNVNIDDEKFKFDSKNKYIKDVKNINPNDFRIRKLTPKECWRLMGFRDEHIEEAMALGISDSQLYKQAGNSIVVDVLYYIFKELFKEYIVE